MTITTEVRINWPVPAVALLDHVTRVAGGDPATVRRRVETVGTGGTAMNVGGQGLRTLAWIRWAETPDTGEESWLAPEAMVVLTLDNPYGFGPPQNTGRWVQANEILPAVVEWLDNRGVPRDRWWWEDETAGTFHPGTTLVQYLVTDDPRETWTPPESS